MHDIEMTASRTTTPTPWRRTTVRWLVTFLGFPLGGFAAYLLVGRVDTLAAALFGGLITGLALGAVQAWGLGRSGLRGLSAGAGPPAAKWTAATGIGLMVGLGIGAMAVNYDTSLTALVIQGAICGLAVGAAQAWVLRARLGHLAVVWPPALGALWALGWVVTRAGGIQVDQQFTVFGASGALFVTAMTVILPLAINRREASTS